MHLTLHSDSPAIAGYQGDVCGTGDNGPQLTASVLQGTAGGGPAAFVAGQPPTAGVPAMSGWRQRPQSSQARWPPPHPPAVGSDGVCRAGALGPHLAPPLTQSASPLLHRGGCDVGAPARRRVPPSSTKRVVGGAERRLMSRGAACVGHPFLAGACAGSGRARRSQKRDGCRRTGGLPISLWPSPS